MPPEKRSQWIQQVVVTADQMRQIEGRLFTAGMPIAALMEKVAGLISRRVMELQPISEGRRVGVLVGPGHNGGDALVVARELHLRGYEVLIHCPFAKLKELTGYHATYCRSLGIPWIEPETPLPDCDFWVDGLFGFGLERELHGSLVVTVEQVNQRSQPRISIDLPSGLHTDSGKVLGTAIRATHTLCLGLWKQGLLQDHALEFVGQAELLDFDLPMADVQAVLGDLPTVCRTTPAWTIAQLPLVRPAATHKYKMGHLLLVCGSHRYAGGAVLTGLGARSSGVGMLSIAVPASLKPILTAHLPEALVLECPETETGAIAHLPEDLNFNAYQAIACGPGLTIEATAVVQAILASDRPLVLDADGLNILAQQGTIPTLQVRTAPTILTPHLGEFQRLFPPIAAQMECRVTAVQTAAQQSGAIVLLKGACVAIASPDGQTWINPQSTSALARGGSGDVLTGLLGGLLAQPISEYSAASFEFKHATQDIPFRNAARFLDAGGYTKLKTQNSIALNAAATAAWWHAHAGILAMQGRTTLGVDAFTLTQYLIPTLQHWQQQVSVPSAGF